MKRYKTCRVGGGLCLLLILSIFVPMAQSASVSEADALAAAKGWATTRSEALGSGWICGIDTASVNGQRWCNQSLCSRTITRWLFASFGQRQHRTDHRLLTRQFFSQPSVGGHCSHRPDEAPTAHTTRQCGRKRWPLQLE